jgi:hypothetical protein
VVFTDIDQYLIWVPASSFASHGIRICWLLLKISEALKFSLAGCRLSGSARQHHPIPPCMSAAKELTANRLKTAKIIAIISVLILFISIPLLLGLYTECRLLYFQALTYERLITLLIGSTLSEQHWLADQLIMLRKILSAALTPFSTSCRQPNDFLN